MTQQIDSNSLKPWARKYIWWQTPEQAVQRPLRVVAQVMNIGDYDDVQALLHMIGEPLFRQAIAYAEAGQFNNRSWSYWHYRLGLAEFGHLPPLPQRLLS